jgi:arsenite-transporting ATPase
MSAARARLLLFTGKGGVGKTTVAAATALRCAQAGQRTLVLSTDPAHSLADVFDTSIGANATSLTPTLDAEQVDVAARLEETWGELRAWLVDLMGWAGLDAVEAEELIGVPGLDELVALADLVDRVSDARWDTVVVDCAPTGETLRLLSLPDVGGRWAARAWHLGHGVTRALAPVIRQLSAVPLADERVFTSGARLAARLSGARDLLSDASQTRVRLVVNPERVVIAETLRTATYLALYGYPLDMVVANRMLPAAVTDPWFETWRSLQAGHLQAVREAFEPLAIACADLAPTEVVGVEALGDLAMQLYGEHDPTAAHPPTAPLRIDRAGSGYDLVVELPFSSRDDVDLGRQGDELVVRVAGHRRRIALPDSLRRRRASAATLREGRLVVRFEDPV